jgi:SPOR domain
MDDFWYNFKRYAIALIIIILLLFFPARRFLRQHGYFLFDKKTLKAAMLWARQDSIRVADSLKRIKTESNIPADKQKDTMDKPVKEENPLQTAETDGTYFIIAGSFSNIENARLAVKKFMGRGYKAGIISIPGKNGVMAELVYVKTFTTANEASMFLEEFKSKIDSEAWIYSHKLRLAR